MAFKVSKICRLSVGGLGYPIYMQKSIGIPTHILQYSAWAILAPNRTTHQHCHKPPDELPAQLVWASPMTSIGNGGTIPFREKGASIEPE
jgi:hypothetical protein